MLSNKFSGFRNKVQQSVRDLKVEATKKWNDMQEAPDDVPDHWEEHTDDNGNKFFIDMTNGEMYRVSKRQHKRIDTLEKVSLVEQMTKSTTSPVNEKKAKLPWKCKVCTLENAPNNTECEACQTPRPEIPNEEEPDTPSNLKNPDTQHNPVMASADSPIDTDNAQTSMNGHSPSSNNASPSTNNNNNTNTNTNTSNNHLQNGSRPESTSFNKYNDEDEKKEELSENDEFLPVSNGHAPNGNLEMNGNGNYNDDNIKPPNDKPSFTHMDSLGVPNQYDENGNQRTHSPSSTMDAIQDAVNESLAALGDVQIDHLNADEKSVLLQFMELTDEEPEPALKLLQGANWDINAAIEKFFTANPDHPKSRQVSLDFGLEDINKILDPADQDGKRGSVDMGQPQDQLKEPSSQHTRLSTEENIKVAQIASLQQAEFDRELEDLRTSNVELKEENAKLKSENIKLTEELQEKGETIDSLTEKLERGRRREEELKNAKLRHREQREQFQKDWDRMNATFTMIISELSQTTDALKKGDTAQVKKLDELIQQVKNLRSPGDYLGDKDSREVDAFDRVADLFPQNGTEQTTPIPNGISQGLTGITVTGPSSTNNKPSNHTKKISMGGVNGIFSQAPPNSNDNIDVNIADMLAGMKNSSANNSLAEPIVLHSKNKLSFGGVGDLFPSSPDAHHQVSLDTVDISDVIGEQFIADEEQENEEQKQSMHGRTQSRSFQVFHQKKSSDPTYDRQKPAHTRSEHSRGPSFTLSKDIFGGAENVDNDENIDPSNNKSNNNTSNINNNNNNNNNDNEEPQYDSDENHMRHDSITKSENDEDMIAIIAYYDLENDDDDEYPHSRNSSWFGDYGRVPQSRRVSSKTPNTVKELFDDVPVRSNGSTPQSNVKELFQGRASRSSRQPSRGVTIQPSIPETAEEEDNNIDTHKSHGVRELFDDDNNPRNNNNSNNNNNIDNAIAKQEQVHSQGQTHRKENGQFNAEQLTPISTISATGSGRPSRAGPLGNAFDTMQPPNFEELEKTHLTPVSVYNTPAGRGLEDASVEEKANDPEREAQLRQQIKKELEEEFEQRMNKFEEETRAKLLGELRPEIETEFQQKMVEETKKQVTEQLENVRTELNKSFEFQMKTLRHEMKETEEDHRKEVTSMAKTKMELVNSTSEEIESLRQIIKENFSSLRRRNINNSNSANTSNNNNNINVSVPNVFAMLFNK